MYWWELLVSELTKVSKHLSCCQTSAVFTTMSGPFGSDPSENHHNIRHERSIIRMCALLWVLKVHEDNLRRRANRQLNCSDENGVLVDNKQQVNFYHYLLFRVLTFKTIFGLNTLELIF